MYKNKKIIIAGVLIILIWTIWSGRNIPEQTTINPIGISYVSAKETTVYDFMSELQNENKINFTEKNYIGMGKLIDSINGIRSNGEKTWIYYVNDKKAMVGVSNYKLKPGDVVSWKYEKLLGY